MADPATIAIAVRSCAAIAGAIVRGIASLVDKKPVDPWKYYRLGGLVERWRQGWTAGASMKERGAKWTAGAYVTGNEGTGVSDKNVLKGAGANDVNWWARRLLHGNKGVRKIPNMPMYAKLSGLKNDYSEDAAHWVWVELGRAEYRDRYIVAARKVLKMDPDNFYLEYDKVVTNAGQLGAAWNEAGRKQGTELHRKALRAQERLREFQAKQKAILPVWRKVDAPPMLNSKAAADKELARWVAARSMLKAQAIADAHWYGPPVPWALELACRFYGQDGPAALVRYLSISGRVTAEVRKLAAQISPAALADPSLSTFWSRAW